jgi:succinate dehydrogenase / fumarate reductase, cytochrome b subunit
MSNPLQNPRPVYRNLNFFRLLGYRLPLAGKLSILHRISGIALFFALPVILLPLLDRSLTSEISFEEMKGVVDSIFVKLILLGLIWSYLHHFCAGIRFLLLDFHVGVDKQCSQRSALVSFAVSLMLTALFGLKLFGVF